MRPARVRPVPPPDRPLTLAEAPADLFTTVRDIGLGVRSAKANTALVRSRADRGAAAAFDQLYRTIADPVVSPGSAPARRAARSGA